METKVLQVTGPIKRISSVIRLALTLTVLSLFVDNSVAQDRILNTESNQPSANAQWKSEAFGSYDPSRELVGRRSANEKHFQRQDGQVDMFVSSEPINYLENGQWKTIFTSIDENINGLYKYSNLNNSFKSYYPENIQDGFKTIINNEEIFEMANATMYYEANGQKLDIKEISSSKGKAQGNKLTYSNVYGNFIDLQITQSGGRRKLDYIIRDRDAINPDMVNAQFLVFTEEITLPDGWSAKLDNGVILIMNDSRQVTSIYELPSIFDSNSNLPKKPVGTESDLDLSTDLIQSKMNKGTKTVDIISKNKDILYEIQLSGNKLLIETKVDLNYLLNESRLFPVFVDPTLTNNIAATTTYWYDYVAPYGPASISTSGAPANSSITNVNVALNVTRTQYYDWFFGVWATYTGNCNSWHNFSIHDEVYPNYNSYQFTCGGNTSYFNCKDPNRSWRTEIWSWDGDDYRARWGYTVTVTYETVTAPTSISGTSAVCSGTPTTLSAVGGTSSAGSTAITTQWFSGSCGGTAVGTGASISVSPSTTTTYFVRRVGQCTTTACASLSVTVNQPSVAPTTITGTTTICQGLSTTLTANGSLGTGSSYQWGTGSVVGVNPIAGSSSSITVSPSTTTTYWVRIVNTSSPCAATTSGVTVNVNVNQLSVAPTGITGNNSVCSGGSTVLTLSGGSAGTGATAQWFSGSCGGTAVGTGNSITVSPTSPTDYFVRYSGSCNTTTCATVSVGVSTNSTPLTSVLSSATGSICPNSNVTLTASGGTDGTGSAIEWYSGPNGTGTLLGNGSSIVIAPSANTTVYVRRSGTCNTTADASVAVDVKAFTYAANNTSSTGYCTDNSGWNHFFNGDNIIFSVQGDLSGAPVGFPVATIFDNGAYYSQTENGTAAGCGSNQNPGEQRFEMERSWDLNFGGGTPSGSYSVRFYHEPAERQAVETAAANWIQTYPACGYSYKYTPVQLAINGFYWFKNNGSAYTAPDYDGTHLSQNTVATTSNGVTYAQLTGITSFSGGSGAVILTPIQGLPVELISFTANCNESGDQVTVNWVTASEHNSSHFVIERSIDGGTWENMHVVPAAGNSTALNEYTFVDTDARGYENLYYRLVQFDNDGVYEVYGPVSVQCEQKNVSHRVFPNPNNGAFTLELIDADQKSGTYSVQVQDGQGKILYLNRYNVENGFGQYMVNMPVIAPGIYYLIISDQNDTYQTIKLFFR